MPRVNLPALLTYLEKRLGTSHGSGPEYTFHCPACLDRLGDESDKPKFWFNTNKLKGVCYRCDWKVSKLETMFRYLNGGSLTPIEMAIIRGEQKPVDDLHAEIYGKLIAKVKEAQQDLKAVDLPQGCELLAEADPKAPRFRNAFKYLQGRGIGMRLIEKHSICYCTRGDYRGYLIFPVIQGGDVVYWTNRYAGHSALKTKNPPNHEGFHQRKTCVLGYDNLIGQRAIQLVEGPFDMMAYDHAGAFMGKAVSPQQLRLIYALVEHGLEEVTISFDPDAGKAADKLYHQLLGRVPTVNVLFLTHGDPAERRTELPGLMQDRRRPSILDRAKARLSSG